MYNTVGDPAYCTIKRTNKISIRLIGPVKPGEELCLYDSVMAYTSVCDKIVIDTLDLEYMDGTKETIKYGYSTTDRRRR